MTKTVYFEYKGQMINYYMKLVRDNDKTHKFSFISRGLQANKGYFVTYTLKG